MDLQSKLAGLKDSRSMQAMMARGTNIYPGGSKAASKGVSAKIKAKHAHLAKKMLGK